MADKDPVRGAGRPAEVAAGGENDTAAAETKPRETIPHTAANGAEADKITAESLRYENKKQVFKGGVLGAFIGLAIIVPGVSGSAIAIIFRLYEKLLFALGNLLRKFRACARFLLPVAVGAALGLILGFFGVKALLGALPFATVALFAGLMLGAYPAVTDQLKGEKLTATRFGLFAAGFALPVLLSILSAFAAPEAGVLEGLHIGYYIVFVALGFLVAATQLIPGLSATALLMMFGYFTPLVESVSLHYWQGNPMIFLVYFCLILGFVAGLLCVSKVLSLLIARRRAATFYTVAGLSLGSAATMFFNPEILGVYRNWSAGGGMWPDLGIGIALFAAGIVLAYLFVRYERKRSL